jgi:hypothetical protein
MSRAEIPFLFALGILVSLGCQSKLASSERFQRGPIVGGPLFEEPTHTHYLELRIDQAKKQATVYTLDEHAHHEAPIKARSITLTLTHEPDPLQIPLQGVPNEANPTAARRFVGKHERLAREVDPTQVTITLEIDGNPPEVFTLKKR